MIVSARQSWPLAADYSKMLQHPELAFKNPELQQCLIETMHGNNQPRPRAGAFAVVYRARYPGSDRHVAVRAFTKESKERQHRYHAIREYLRGRKLECLVDFDYSDQGIRSTDGRFYPLVTMEWVQGDALFEWVEARCLVGDRDALTQACEDWIALIDELQSNEIAHGDLQHGNIMVTPDHQLKLVDYDCMCVPSLIGEPNLEIGVVPYQHPDRNADTQLDVELDNFSALFIYTALRALAAEPKLWKRHVTKRNYDKLLFQLEDIDYPDQSQLAEDLKRSPDSEVPELFEQLCSLAKSPLHRVPRLHAVLRSDEELKEALRNREWIRAVELLNQCGGRDPDLDDDLQIRANRARECVECLESVKQAIDHADEETLARVYDPALLDDLPEAQPYLSLAQTADQAWDAIQDLLRHQNNEDWRELVRCWDQHASLLEDRVSAASLKKQASQWRKRNTLCDQFLALMNQEEPPLQKLTEVWEKLESLGGHPEASEHRERYLEHCELASAWTIFQEALEREPSEQNDQRLLDAWDESRFENHEPAHEHRPRLEEANKRLQIVRQINETSRSVGNEPTLESEEAICRLQRSLSKTRCYEHHQQDRCDRAERRVVACQKVVAAIEDDNEPKMLLAWNQLSPLNGKSMLSAAQQRRVALAQKRARLLNALQALKGLPLEEMDEKILELWDERVLRDCKAAKSWRARRHEAQQRKQKLQELEEAIANHDERKIDQCSRSTLLTDCTFDSTWTRIIETARSNVAKANELLSMLKANERARFREAFDLDLINDFWDLLGGYQSVLEDWIRQEILPLSRIGLALPRVRAAVFPVRETTYELCWEWPEPRFSDMCMLAICRSRPGREETPSSIEPLRSSNVSRELYESEGGCTLRVEKAWKGASFVVWARLKIGDREHWSEPLVLDSI